MYRWDSREIAKITPRAEKRVDATSVRNSYLAVLGSGAQVNFWKAHAFLISLGRLSQMDAQWISSLADREMESLRQVLPRDSMGKCVALIEVQRYFDSRMFDLERQAQIISVQQDTEVMRWGMNLCTSELLCPIDVEGAIPILKVSEQRRLAARNLLYRFGVVALLRRAAEMVRVGMLRMSGDQKQLTLSEDGRFIHQFMDELEVGKLATQLSSLKSGVDSHSGWSVVGPSSAEAVRQQLGAFTVLGRLQKPRVALTSEEIINMISPLNRPMPTPYGTFLEYETDTRLDKELSYQSQEALSEAIEQAGIHLSVKFDGFNAVELLIVISILRVWYTRHIHHCRVAELKMPDVDIAASLTLWQPKLELIDLLAAEAALDHKKLERILRCLTVNPSDVNTLAEESVSILPMFIDLGNGVLLRPLSSIVQNQLVTFSVISRWRDKNAINAISAAREDWFRQHLYALFQGNRYKCVAGNVLLRDGGKKITDIDAAVLDRVTGELAIFQLKWQDYFSSSVKQLGSRAKNFSQEVDGWAGAISAWVRASSVLGVGQSLRLDPKRGEIPLKIYLFAISWRVARSAGYGYPVESPFLSVASWPQFCRARMQLGPADSVFDSLHRMFRDEEVPADEGFRPVPYTVTLAGGERVIFEDLWHSRAQDGPPA